MDLITQSMPHKRYTNSLSSVESESRSDRKQTNKKSINYQDLYGGAETEYNPSAGTFFVNNAYYKMQDIISKTDKIFMKYQGLSQRGGKKDRVDSDILGDFEYTLDSQSSEKNARFESEDDDSVSEISSISDSSISFGEDSDSAKNITSSEILSDDITSENPTTKENIRKDKKSLTVSTKKTKPKKSVDINFSVQSKYNIGKQRK